MGWPVEGETGKKEADEPGQGNKCEAAADEGGGTMGGGAWVGKE